MIAFEEAIAKRLASLGNVDGHDAGSGEMNIFILTDRPALAFDQIRPLFAENQLASHLKAAYRAVDEDKYRILYPTDLTQFDVK